MIHSIRGAVWGLSGALERIACVSLGALMLTACSRSVQWEEEVLLNTGETIVVARHGTYTYKVSIATGANGYAPDQRSTIEFTYKGKRYSYTGEALVQLIAVGPEKSPTLVADARGWGNKNSYPCVTPYYVQFNPDHTGKEWSWHPRIDTWLYNLPTNLMIGLAPFDSTQRRFDAAARRQVNASLLSFAANYQRIDPMFKPENCVQRN